jgi:hypothetical protein
MAFERPIVTTHGRQAGVTHARGILLFGGMQEHPCPGGRVIMACDMPRAGRVNHHDAPIRGAAIGLRELSLRPRARPRPSSPR